MCKAVEAERNEESKSKDDEVGPEVSSQRRDVGKRGQTNEFLGKNGHFA